MSDYVQDLGALVAAMQLHLLFEEIRVTIFTRGLRTGAARTEVFRVRPLTLKGAVDISFHDEFNFKANRYGTHGRAQSSFDRF